MRFARASAKCVSPKSWSLVARHRSLGVGACKANLIKLTTSNERSNRQLKASFAQQVSSSSFEMSEQQYQVLQPVKVTNLGLKTYTGDNILSDCFSNAFVTEKDADGVVLGLDNSNRAVAIQDFSLGKAKTQFLLMQTREDGPYVVLLPLINIGTFRATLRPPRKGLDGVHDLRIRIESGDESVTASKWDHALYIAAGNDPFALLDTAVAKASACSGGAKPLSRKQVPKSLDVFGWCSWDAFYFRVSAQGIMNGLKSLKEGGVPPRLLVIDDGWQLTEVDDPFKEAAAAARLAQASALKKPAIAEGITGGDPDALTHQADATGRPSADATDSNQSMLPQNTLSSSELSNNKGRVLWAKESLLSVWVSVLEMLGRIVSKLLYSLNSVFSSMEIPAWVLNLMSVLARGPMNNKLLQLYAEGGDHSRRLSSVLANGKFSSAEAGPDEPWEGDHKNTEDLTTVVQHVKREFGLEFVYCWHALHAYWSGVSPTAAAVESYGSQITFPTPTPGVVELEPSMVWNPQVVAGIGAVTDPTKLHKDMHTYLADCGVDGVKVDVQATVGLMGSKLGGGPAMTRKYHQSLESSVQAAFPGNHCINCMCHSTENLYRMENTAVARVSDDFYPLDAASWSSHLGICAYNSLFMAPLVQPDWDMFHSKHPAALLHATARVVSGGGIYVSDKPGAHDFGLLRRLVLPNGCVLRPQLPGRPTKDILFADVLKDNKTLLKVWNKNPVNGMVGVFNVQGSSWSRKKRQFYTHDPSPPVLETLVRPTDVHTFVQPGGAPQHFAMYSDQTQQITLSAHQEDGVTVKLAAGKSDVVTVAPIFGIGTSVQWACIGLVNMLNAGGSVLEVKVSDGQGNRKGTFCQVLIKGCGELVMYASSPPADATGNGAGLRHNYNLEQKKLVIEVPETADLETRVQVRF